MGLTVVFDENVEFNLNSTGLSVGNQVDGLPGV